MALINGNELSGKRILLISLSGYSSGIIRRMKELGAIVDYIDDKPNDGFLCKVLGRLQVGFYQKVLDKYYLQAIDQIKGNAYDFILVIRGEYTTHKALESLKRSFPNAKMVLYMWDGLHKFNTRGIEKKWVFFDKVYTFDRIDYEANKEELKFLPLFYYEECIPEEDTLSGDNNYQYDISFIGTGHSDRVAIVKDVMRQCRERGKKTYMYVYMPHIVLFFLNIITNRFFKGVKRREIQFKKISFVSLYKIYHDSKAIVDVEHPGQHGLTMRSIEIIGLRRKLITTNPDIVNYDFYNPSNILVIDREKPILDMHFLETPYVELPSEIYQKYSLRNWLLELFS